VSRATASGMVDSRGARIRRTGWGAGDRHRPVHHDEGNSAEEIADELGVSVISVRRVLETS